MKKHMNGKYWSLVLLTAGLFAPGTMQATQNSKVQTLAVAAAEQSQTVKGQILDEVGAPIIGANIIIKGTSVGVASNVDGKFSIPNVTFPVVLKVSYIGYTEKEIKVSSNKPIIISLETDVNLMEEVIVTGYGTYKKSAYAGSASAVGAKKLKDIPAVSFQNMLQGNASGVQFSAPSGMPGSSAQINIRGMGSFNASSTPLYVIDGVPVISGSIDATGSDAGLDVMSTLNPSDIENISIIKDAAAASLYGSRAANGVILITTKQGKKGKAQISLKADWGFSDFAMDYRPVMDGATRRQYIYDGLKEYRLRKGESEADAIAYADNKVDDYAPIPWCGFVDWDDILFKKGSYQNYEASVSGGADRYNYYASLAYTKQDGVTLNSGLERMTGRINATFQATKHLKLGANIMFSNVDQDVYSEGLTYTSPFYSSRSCVVPSDPVYNEDGSWNRSFIRNKDRNPLLSMTYDTRREHVIRSFNTMFAEIEFIKDLKLKSTLSYDYTNIKGEDWNDHRTSNGDDENGDMYKKFKEYRKMVWANQLSYKFNINDDHHFDALVGYEMDEHKHDYLYAESSNFATFEKHPVSNGMKTESLGGYDIKSRIISYLTRVNYDYKNRYYLGASYRTDGSSKLAPNNRWGHFWSVSGAWRIIDEDFMEGATNWLSDLKLRASYGVNGTLPSDYFGYMGLSSLTDGYLSMPAFSLKQIANPNLEWETNHNVNIGLDFGFVGRVSATIEYYNRITKNLLMDCPVSYTTGFGSYLMNIGKVRNRGVEFEITSTNFSTKDFTWTTSFNISHNRNEILKLDGKQTEIVSGSLIHKVGEPYRTFYMVEFAGINPENGLPQFYTNDLDEKGNYIKEITQDKRKANAIPLDKHAEPTAIGGFTNSFRYKWFDLSFMFNYQFGGYSYDALAQKTEHGGYDMKANIPVYYKDNWKKPGDKARYEVFMKSPKTPMHKMKTSRRVHSSDYIRLKTLTFGVTAPQEWTRKIGINSARIYVSANNLWTWASYDFYDPEAVHGGYAIYGTPPLKTVTFGLNVNF